MILCQYKRVCRDYLRGCSQCKNNLALQDNVPQRFPKCEPRRVA